MVIVKTEGNMHKKITLFGIATAIVIVAVCIGAAGGAAVAVNAGQTQKQMVSDTASAGMQKDQMANVDVPVQSTAAHSDYAPASYANYDAIWSSSSNQFIPEGVSGIAAGTTPAHWDNSFTFTIAANSYTVMNTPFVNTISKNGIHPRVRFLYFELKMPVGVSVTNIGVASGANMVYAGPVSWAGTGTVKDYTLDMGSYKDMVRGINTGIRITNSLDSNAYVESYGAGAKQEW